MEVLAIIWLTTTASLIIICIMLAFANACGEAAGEEGIY